MSEIVYKNLVFEEEGILNLYLSNEWYAYTNNKESLFKGIKNSLDVIGAYDGELLIGLIRTIGDKETIIYIQDILVLPEYHRRGIGTKLLKDMLSRYNSVRQVILSTDNLEKTRKFYESIGMIAYDTCDVVGFIAKK